MSPSATDDPGFGVYVHWPYCAAICPYCAFNVVRDRGRTEEKADLLSALRADLEGWRARTGPKPLTSLYLGGGTPSLLGPDDVADLVAAARALWTESDEIEVTLEANPDDCAPERLAVLRAAGINRLSIGVQALDDAALRALGRTHSAAGARAAVERAAALFDRVSIDLIYARPGQALAAWAAELAETLTLPVEHVSLYELSIEPGTAFARRAARGEIAAADDERGAAFFETNAGIAAAAGFAPYETSNYAREPAARSQHNLLYWRSGEWAGVGPGAHGRLGALGGERLATETDKRIDAYVAHVARTGWGASTVEELDAQAQLAESLLMGLRLVEGVALDRLTGLEAWRVEALEAEGLLARAGGRLAATDLGRPLVDRIVLELVG